MKIATTSTGYERKKHLSYIAKENTIGDDDKLGLGGKNT